MNLTWNCQICGKERPDEKISVLTYPMKDLPSAEVNIKYCNDNPKCWEGALDKRKRGDLT